MAPTIFAEMSAAAARTGAINLGQGFPDEDGPAAVLEAAREAIANGANQYPPGRGIPDLLAAISEHQQRFYGLSVDPGTEVIVTAGATEALTATLLALIDEPDDEVVVFEPYYDSYAAAVALAGALSEVLQGGSDTALDTYSASQRRRAQRVLKLTGRLTRIATLPRPLRPIRNSGMRLAAQLQPLRRQLALQLSGLGNR